MSHLGFTDPGQAAAPSSGEVSEALSFQSLVLPASLKSSCPQLCLTALVGDSEAFSVSPSSRSGLWRWGRPGWGAQSPQSIMEQIMGLGRVVEMVRKYLALGLDRATYSPYGGAWRAAIESDTTGAT